MIQLTERRYHGTMLVRRLSFAQAPADPHNICLINRLWSWPLHGFGLREMDLNGVTSKAPTGGHRKNSLDVVYTCLLFTHLCASGANPRMSTKYGQCYEGNATSYFSRSTCL